MCVLQARVSEELRRPIGALCRTSSEPRLASRMGIGPLCTPLAAKFSQTKEAICPLVHLSVSKPGSLEGAKEGGGGGHGNGRKRADTDWSRTA